MLDFSIAVQLIKSLLGLSGYVESGGSFPRPLSSDKEKLWLGRLQQGDEHARNVLVEHNLRLVAHVGKKFIGCGIDQEDIIAIGTIGLIKAINSFNPDKGTQLATYSARCIENEIRMTIRASRKRRNDIYLQDPIGVDREGNTISLQDILGTDPDEVMEKVVFNLEIDEVREIIENNLQERDRKVILMRYGLEGKPQMTQREVAARLGISRSYVSRIEKRALENIRKAILSLECKEQNE